MRLRTNLLTYSNPTADGSGWTAARQLNLLQHPSRDGTSNALRYNADSNSSLHLAQSPAYSFVSGKTYTMSCDIKKKTERYVQMTFTSAAFGSSQYVNFDRSGLHYIHINWWNSTNMVWNKWMVSCKLYGNSHWFLRPDQVLVYQITQTTRQQLEFQHSLAL